MDKLKELVEKRAAAIAAMETLNDTASKANRAMDPAEETVFNEKAKEVDELSKSIAAEEKLIALRASLATPVKTGGNPAPTGRPTIPAQAKSRYGKLTAFKGENAAEDAYRSGMFIRAVILGDENAKAWCSEHGVAMTKAQGENTNVAGGFLVPTEFETSIIDLREAYGTFRNECRLVPMGSDSMTIPRRTGGLTAYPVTENVAATESQKNWDQITLNAKKIAVLTRMSSELAEDAVINLADDLAGEMAYAFARFEDGAGWNGDGTGPYAGIVGVRTKIIDGTHTASAIAAASTHNTFAEIDAVDLTNVMAALPKYAEPSAKWYVSTVGWASVFQRLMAAAGGNNTETLNGRVVRRYLGYEVVIDQTLPTVAPSTDQAAAAMLFFGDLRMACRMGERRGVTIKTSTDAYFTQDQIAILGTERIDINVHDLGSNSAAGPLIGLIGTA